METGGRTHPDRLWIGAIPAGLFRSDDRGESWQLVNAHLPPIYAVRFV
jgi:hypothetical protein